MEVPGPLRAALTRRTTSTPAAAARATIAAQLAGLIFCAALPAQQFLYFFPLPQGQRSLRPTFA